MVPTRRLRVAFILMAAALALGACSAGGAFQKTSGAGEADRVTAVSTPSFAGEAATASATPSFSASQAATATGVATPLERLPCEPIKFISPQRGTDRPHIWYDMSRVQEWRCDRLRPGLTCAVGFSGSWAGPVDVDTETYIRFVAWERGKAKPVQTVDAGPLPAYGEFTSLATRFLYKVGNTDKVRFYLQLLNRAKVPIATGDTFVYNTNCVEK